MAVHYRTKILSAEEDFIGGGRVAEARRGVEEGGGGGRKKVGGQDFGPAMCGVHFGEWN